ncbi:MAG: hypothetical protein KC646_00665 [Candidatus Cloacimonetes bacterium]|nr:hypothetical protein [Candidatus Cloacimonadota bacterium]
MSSVQTKANVKAKASATSKSASWFKPQFLLMDWFRLSQHLKEQSEQSNIKFKVNPYFAELLAQQSNAIEHLDNFKPQNLDPNQDCIKSDLLEQSRLDPKNSMNDQKMLANLIEYLDPKGYMTADIFGVFCIDFSLNSAQVNVLINRLKNYEPKGFGCRGLKDFFLLCMNDTHQTLKLRQVLENNDFLNIAKQTDHIIEKYKYTNSLELQKEIAFVYQLSEKRQYPAHNLNFASQAKPTRLADFKIKLNHDQSFEVSSYLSDITVPDQLTTDQIYLKQIEKRIQLGPLLIEHLLNYQKDYLFNPEPYELKPLTRTQFYQDLHTKSIFKETLPYSTMCLILQDKILSTSNGDYYKVSHFFTKKLNEQANEVSRDHVMDVIQSIISHEQANNPYSDQELVQNIQSVMDLSIARKTIEKYRNLLLIPSKVIRKLQYNLQQSLHSLDIESSDYKITSYLVNLYPNPSNIHQFKEFLLKEALLYLTKQAKSFVNDQTLFKTIKKQGQIRVSNKLMVSLREEIIIDAIRPLLDFNSSNQIVSQAKLIQKIRELSPLYLKNKLDSNKAKLLLQRHLILNEDTRKILVVLRSLSQQISQDESLSRQVSIKKLKQTISKVLKIPVKKSNYTNIESKFLEPILTHIIEYKDKAKLVNQLSIYDNKSIEQLKHYLLQDYKLLKA